MTRFSVSSRLAFLLCYSYLLILVKSLSTNNKVSNTLTKRPIERVAIIGSGIAGLATAHALINLDHNNNPIGGNNDNEKRIGNNPNGIKVSIFDSRSSFNFQDGAGIQLNGGLQVLGKINPKLLKAVMDAGMPQERIRSRAKSWNTDKAYDDLLDLDLEKLIQNAGSETSEALINENGNLLWYAIMRGALQEALLKELPPEVSSRTSFAKKLIGIIPSGEDGGGVTCQFQDGSTAGPFDLVVGCDGIKSAVKNYVERGKIDDTKYSPGIYSGMRIRYAIQDGDDDDAPQVKASTLTQYFGDGAYGLHGVYGAGNGRPRTKCAFLVSQDEGYFGPFKKKKEEPSPSSSSSSSSFSVVETSSSQTTNENPAGENEDWKQENRQNTETAREQMLIQLKKCNIPDLEVRPTIENADRFFELGVYFHNPFSFSGWSKQVTASGGTYVVLCGDAAHAMPPFLGQGANQAIQDAYCLATKIIEYNANLCKNEDFDLKDENEKQRTDLKFLLKEYENTRWSPTFSITAKSAILGYVETGGNEGLYSKPRDVFWRVMGLLRVPQLVLADTATPKV